jgi:ferrous iron transport protein B
LDEQVARDFLTHQDYDLVINVVDATHIERQLFLTAQLLHMGIPMLVVLNRMDKLDEAHLAVDIDQLAQRLGCPVIPMSAYHNIGLDELHAIIPARLGQVPTQAFHLPKDLAESVAALRNLSSSTHSDWQALQWLVKPANAPADLQTAAIQRQAQLEQLYQETLSLVSADLYFQFAHDATHASVSETDRFSPSMTDQIDRWVLHPIWGLPIFLLVMYAVFAFSIALGNVFLDFFDLGAQAIFVDGQAWLLGQLDAPDWLIAIMADGLGGGIQVVASFIPVIGALFLILSLLEESGYMQRAALMMDRLMRRIGLSGQAFIPLVIGFGCNIPAVMATRTLPNQRDRILTVLMTPFMSCSARLTVYVLFAAVFFNEHAALLVFSLYLIGILAALATAYLLKYTLLPGEAKPLLLELPTYHKPSIINMLIHTRNRLKAFIFGAGKVIVLVVLVINLLNSWSVEGHSGASDQPNSVLSVSAQMLTPALEPLGIREENWPAVVGLFTGILAKEVVVGSLDALYYPSASEPDADFHLYNALAEALASIPANLGALLTTLLDPIGLASLDDTQNAQATAEALDIQAQTLNKMAELFASPYAAYAYLILILLYFPCVATLGAMKRELGMNWMLYSTGWSLFLGYTLAVAFYQVSQIPSQPQTAFTWLIGIALSYALWFALLKRAGRKALVS